MQIISILGVSTLNYFGRNIAQLRKSTREERQDKLKAEIMTTVLVTTGATVTFKALLDYVMNPQFIKYLVESVGVNKLIIQYGNEIVGGKNISKEYINGMVNEVVDDFDLSITNETNDKSVINFSSSTAHFDLVLFSFSKEINSYIESADLVISHAGTGSIIDSLSLYKPLIVVVNDTLMDNHQEEIADKLQDLNCLVKIGSKDLTKLNEAVTNILTHDQKFDPLPSSSDSTIESILHDEVVNGSA